MEFSGTYHIAAAPDAVWTGLNDPAVLRACVPGCEALEKTGPTEFTATVQLKIGPMTARFGSRITMEEADPPHRCRLRGEGSGAAGFARGDAEILLAAEEGGTGLRYTARAAIGGKLAQIGQRLLDGAARSLADDFFRRFSAALAPAAVTAPTPAAELVTPAAGLPDHHGLGTVVLAAFLVIAGAILLILFGLVL